MPRLSTTDLDVHPLCLGGNVFGWTADAEQSFAVLDAYAAGGGNFIDTADVYSSWVAGHEGGESETILGQWMADRGNRDDIVIATKVGMLDGVTGLGADTIARACDASLRRLQTDRIDLYYAHADDPSTPLEETLGAFDALVQEGKVRHVAASNYSAERLDEALELGGREGMALYAALQPKYNLVDRRFEDGLAAICAKHDIACVPYSALASGFLSGKYRRDGARVDSVRAGGAQKELDRGGEAILAVLDEVAGAHEAPVAAVALAWLAAQPTVAAPIASARTPEQLADLMAMVDLRLTDDELGRLGAAAE